MQRLTEIRELLSSAGMDPRRRLGQNFLIDANLMRKLVELAAPGGQLVLEVGAATGSLTEELLGLAERVVAVEMDPALAEILRRRLGARERLTVLNCDFLAGKHAIAPAVMEALAGAPRPEDRRGVHLVANLPYGIAVPTIVNCLLASWRAARRADAQAPRFDRLTFTVQRELGDRLTARAGAGSYGPAGVMVSLLAQTTAGRTIPPQAFWPRPKVTSQMLRLDFDAAAAGELADAELLEAVLAAMFRHRRKKIASACRTRGFPFPADVFAGVLAEAGVDPARRPHQVGPEGFRDIANALERRQHRPNVIQ